MGALLITMGAVYFATLILIVLPLCFGVVFNTWREAMRRDEEK